MNIEDFHRYTLEDFDVLKSEEKFGPVWVLTPTVGSLVGSSNVWQRSFVLRSDIKMEKSHWMGEEAGPAVHLDIVHGPEPLKQTRGWKGAYRTGSMDEAVQWLINDINENQKLEIIGHAMEDAQGELSERLDLIDKTTEEFSRYDMDQTMAAVSDAYQAMMAAYMAAKTAVEDL